MCIIIDTNSLAHVFNPESNEHLEFLPVHDWIINGKGKVICGGTKYFDELKKLPRILTIYAELKKKGKAIYVENDEVDKKAILAATVIQHIDFDDQHLIGLLQESKCKLICSLDQRAYPYFTHKNFFKSGNKPKIYRGKRNKALLNDKNIANICKPCTVLNRTQKLILTKL